MSLDIIPEIDITEDQHQSITELRNSCFPGDYTADSYTKQLPHARALEYRDNELIAFMSLDYRVVRSGDHVYRILGVINLCVKEKWRSIGVGTQMLGDIAEYATARDVDFLVLLSDHHQYYTERGFRKVTTINSWLRIHEHKNYGVAVEEISDLYVKPLRDKKWSGEPIDWLGYIY